jgi:hypothetical protein
MFELPTFVITLVVRANRRATLSTPSSAIWGRGMANTHAQSSRKSANKCRRRGQTDEEIGKEIMRKKATIDAVEEGH